MNTTTNVHLIKWPSAPYKEAWDLQEAILQYNLAVKKANKSNGTTQPTLNVFFFCVHHPVYTLGKSGKMENLLLNEEQLEEKKIEFYKINRGGDITYHGPGQITGYPVLDLENFNLSASKYIYLMEQMLMNTNQRFGIDSTRFDGLTGVWVEPETNRARKISAIGVKLSRFISIHGFAHNVNTDLSYFNSIIPCGIDDKAVTSMQNEIGGMLAIDSVIKVMTDEFEKLYGATLKPSSIDEIIAILDS